MPHLLYLYGFYKHQEKYNRLHTSFIFGSLEARVWMRKVKEWKGEEENMQKVNKSKKN